MALPAHWVIWGFRLMHSYGIPAHVFNVTGLLARAFSVSKAGGVPESCVSSVATTRYTYVIQSSADGAFQKSLTYYGRSCGFSLVVPEGVVSVHFFLYDSVPYLLPHFLFPHHRNCSIVFFKLKYQVLCLIKSSLFEKTWNISSFEMNFSAQLNKWRSS